MSASILLCIVKLLLSGTGRMHMHSIFALVCICPLRRHQLIAAIRPYGHADLAKLHSGLTLGLLIIKVGAVSYLPGLILLLVLLLPSGV